MLIFLNKKKNPSERRKSNVIENIVFSLTYLSTWALHRKTQPKKKKKQIIIIIIKQRKKKIECLHFSLMLLLLLLFFDKNVTFIFTKKVGRLLICHHENLFLLGERKKQLIKIGRAHV